LLKQLHAEFFDFLNQVNKLTQSIRKGHHYPQMKQFVLAHLCIVITGF